MLKCKGMKLNEKDLVVISIALGIIILGITSNFLAVTSNNCKMPVLTEINYETGRHFSFQDKSEVKLFYLTDIIGIYRLSFSIGDELIIIGFLALLYIPIKALIISIRKRNRHLKESRH